MYDVSDLGALLVAIHDILVLLVKVASFIDNRPSISHELIRLLPVEQHILLLQSVHA